MTAQVCGPPRLWGGGLFIWGLLTQSRGTRSKGLLESLMTSVMSPHPSAAGETLAQ